MNIKQGVSVKQHKKCFQIIVNSFQYECSSSTTIVAASDDISTTVTSIDDTTTWSLSNEPLGLNCTFEYSQCDWEKGDRNGFWQRKTGPTPSSDTGKLLIGNCYFEVICSCPIQYKLPLCNCQKFIQLKFVFFSSL